MLRHRRRSSIDDGSSKIIFHSLPMAVRTRTHTHAQTR